MLNPYRKKLLIATLLSLLTIAIFLYIFYCAILKRHDRSTEEYIVNKIKEFKKENGRLPFAKNSDELIDTIVLNSNYVYPEDFEYKYYKGSNYYTVIVFGDNDVETCYYDSRTDKFTYKKK